MSERYVFDPRDTRYKSPFGAVECGTEVRFTLRPLAKEQFTGCTLLAWQEFGFYSQEVPLSSPGEGLFTGTFTAPAEPDLVWYGFRFTRADGSHVWRQRSHLPDFSRQILPSERPRCRRHGG